MGRIESNNEIETKIDAVDAIVDYQPRVLLKSITCSGTTPIAVYTVTGDVVMKVFGICKEACTSDGAITLELGVSGNTAGLIAQIADAKNLILNEIRWDATPTTTLEDLQTLPEYVISNGQDVILTTTGTFTAGKVTFYCIWYPLSANGSVA